MQVAVLYSLQAPTAQTTTALQFCSITVDVLIVWKACSQLLSPSAYCSDLGARAIFNLLPIVGQ